MTYHHGIYTVNNRVFTDKLQAIIYASENKLTPNDIEWDYYSEVFNSLNLLQEPELSLDSLYELRARQIREKYDYVVLFASGGSDSTQMCESFLSNDIFVDEVVASAPLEGLSNWEINPLDTSAENTISETFLAQLPYLQELKNKYSVKISINDYFTAMLKYKQDDWLLESSAFIHPTTVARFSLETLPHIKKIAESGKRIAVVYGIDKPQLVLTTNRYVMMKFSDLALNTIRRPFNENFPNVDTVAFYWTPELPILPLKQAHIAATYACHPSRNHILSRIFDQRKENFTRKRNSEYQRFISPIIYPSTYTKKFQAYKPDNPIMAEHDYWYYKLHSNLSLSLDMMNSDISNFKRTVGPDFFQSDRRLRTHFNSYMIGSLEKFKSLSLKTTNF